MKFRNILHELCKNLGNYTSNWLFILVSSELIIIANIVASSRSVFLSTLLDSGRGLVYSVEL